MLESAGEKVFFIQPEVSAQELNTGVTPISV